MPFQKGIPIFEDVFINTVNPHLKINMPIKWHFDTLRVSGLLHVLNSVH